MVVARTNDACVEGFCPHTRLRFLYSDVSETAARLQVQHGNCLASGSVLARALAGIALVGIEMLFQGAHRAPGEKRGLGDLVDEIGAGKTKSALQRLKTTTLGAINADVVGFLAGNRLHRIDVEEFAVVFVPALTLLIAHGQTAPVINLAHTSTPKFYHPELDPPIFAGGARPCFPLNALI